MDFLANHNFSTPWHRDRLDAIAKIAEEWRSAKYEFQDMALIETLAKVKASANNLEELIAYGSWTMRNYAEVQTVKTDEENEIGA